MNRLLLLPLLFVACAHSSGEGLTETQHRDQAARHAKAAQQEQALYNPAASVGPRSRTALTEAGDEALTYNPTEQHLMQADTELREAASHVASANALAAFEDSACRGIPAAERAACPLLASQVNRVQQITAGLRLRLKNPGEGADTNRRLNCHLAFAVAGGFDKPSCPLFVRGMVIRLAEPGVIEMTAATPKVVKELHAEARRLFTGSSAPRSTPLSAR